MTTLHNCCKYKGAVWAILYFALGFFNILFAWFGMIDFLLPLGIAIFGGNKFFCNHLCGRGQLFSKFGGDLKCSRNKPTPRWMSSKCPMGTMTQGVCKLKNNENK